MVPNRKTKETAAYILTLLSMLTLASPAHSGGPIEKLGRGVSNLLTFPCELPWRIIQTHKQNGITAALSYGVVNGVYKACWRAIAGVYEIITFPVPIPGGFEPIVTDPELFF